MHRNNGNLRVFIFVTIVLIGIGIGCGGGAREDPVFTSFVVEPGSVCVDRPNLVRTTWEVDPGDTREVNYWQRCVRIWANGQSVPDSHQCLDEGFEGETTFSLSDLFGTNIPSQVTVEGKVYSGICCSEFSDEESRVVETRICNIGDAPVDP